MRVLEIAREALATGPLCDACLGRLVADRSFGLANDQRGRALRVAVALEDDDPFEAPGEECWVCEAECARHEWWAENAAAALRGYEFETYQVGTRVPPLLEENDRLLREDVGLDVDAGERLKSAFNREVGKRLGETTGTTVDFGRPDVVVLCDLATDEVEVQVNSAFVYGRYRKLERGIPQTRWPCRSCDGTGRAGRGECDDCDGTGLTYQRSVEGLVAPVVEDVMDGVGATFHGAGREDVDARMVGTGRPFVVEVAEPRRRTVDLERLAADVDAFAEGAVAVDGLRHATYGMVERVKTLDASKRYRATVAFDAAVDETALADAAARLDGETVAQYTPARVDHRRASTTRERTVYEATATPEGRREATLEVHGEGGLYVKELVSGDGGRTEPSLAGLLGADCTVTALDVLAVEAEGDEAFADEAFLR